MYALGSQIIPALDRWLDNVLEMQHPRLQDMTDMKSLHDDEVKKVATRHGPTQYLAFDELARRVRENPESWSQFETLGIWNIFDCSRVPDVYEMEWAFLKWSKHLNKGENYDLVRVQTARLNELERQLDRDPASLEIEYFNAIGEELRREG